MNCLKLKRFELLISMIFILSCREKSVTLSRIDYVVPPHININIEDLKSRFADIKTDPAGSYYAVIVFYSYSSGAETISFSGGDDLRTVTAAGRLKALVKVMDRGKLVRAEFVEGEGSSMDEMILSLVKVIKSRV